MSQLYQGIGRTEQSEDPDQAFGGANVGFGYAGSKTGDALDVGFGLMNSDNLKLLQAVGSVGGWETEEGGFQLGAKADGSLFEAGGSLGDAGELLGFETTDSDQGGWENFLSVEGHALKGGGEMSAGTDGLQGGFGVDLFGSSVQLGGAEYDWMLGQELSLGAGVGGGGANFGISWSDDDADGVQELGLEFGGGFGLGIDVAGKNELAGHAWNAAEAASAWAFGEE